VSEPVLRLDGVTKVYPGPPAVEAVRGVDLTVASGELMAIVGPSGSGKSTLLHLMGALDRPTAGEVSIEGNTLSRLSDGRLAGLRAHRIGFVFQEFFLIPGMSAAENVAQGLVYRGTAARRRQTAAEESLERVGLGARIGHMPNQLSGGERQRVAIARALVGDPAMVLADEPTGNLDSETSGAIAELFLALHDQGSTLVVITHDHELADRFPRRVEIRDGRLRERE
jgi:putative ABC transport system ATP-binding protein